MLQAFLITRRSRRSADRRRIFLNLTDQIKQLIKQLSATPTISALKAAQVESIDPQAALRANKEVFFFRLVSTTKVRCRAMY